MFLEDIYIYASKESQEGKKENPSGPLNVVEKQATRTLCTSLKRFASSSSVRGGWYWLEIRRRTRFLWVGGLLSSPVDIRFVPFVSDCCLVATVGGVGISDIEVEATGPSKPI